ncbi:histidine phosphatase family protein [Shewanella sp. UCD-KL12]|uniref:histidine phosphatase family protein n=1 Tax=Shewanella sp. UCD-KL12 TaxID=1917163 RepID=UPI0009FABB92|nr:histidine phosphatase family protein [Shewanella sp. UCD-KL12]
MSRLILLVTSLSLVLSFSMAVEAQDNPTNIKGATKTIVLVRHAEKLKGSKDPNLSPKGAERAKQLAALLKNTPLTLLIASPLNRTQETLQPIAQERNMPITTIGLSEGLEAHVNMHLEMINSHQGNVLVAGHSNTIPMIISALGAPEVEAIAETDYSNIYYLTIDEKNKVLVQHAHYGVSSAKE